MSRYNVVLSVLGGSVFAFVNLLLASNYKTNIPPTSFDGLVNPFLSNFFSKDAHKADCLLASASWPG